MRIQKNDIARIRNAKNNGAIIITDEIIEKIPCMHIFIEDYANKEVQRYIKTVLESAKNRKDNYLYGEVGVLVDKGIMKPGVEAISSISYGDYARIDVSQDENYQNAILEHKGRNLMFIHNHPSGHSFSYSDIVTFVNTSRISTIIAVGNNGKIYVINKGLLYNPNEALKFMNNKALSFAEADKNRLQLKYYQDRAAAELLKRPDKFGFEYYIGGIKS